MKKHLALVISSLRAGGAERVLSELANAWVEEGYKVSLITLADPAEKPFYPLSPAIDLIQLNQSVEEKKSILIRLKNIACRIMALRNQIKQLQPDLIISFMSVMNITTLLAAKGLKIPVVVSERVDPATHPLPSFYKRLRLLTYSWAQSIVVQTRANKEYFPLALQRKIRIIPNMVKPIQSKKVVHKKVHQIISVGRLTAQKDYPTLIHAFSHIAAVYPEIELIIYGEGEDRPNLQILIDKLQLGQRVHLMGIVNHVEKVLSKADLFVSSSLYEGFPNALGEAMSIGLPVIASNCAGIVDIIQDGINGRLFSIRNVSALKELMLELIEDVHQRLKLAKQASKISDTFSEKRILALWEDILNISEE